LFLTGTGPTLDTSPGYDVPEPASVLVLLFAVLSVATMRFGENCVRRARGFMRRSSVAAAMAIAVGRWL